MYTLYYLSKNEQMSYLKIDSFDVPVLVPEDLVFCALRKGINFIKEPHECIDFTDNERLFMHQEFTDTRLVKDGDFRRANTYLTALCQVDPPLLAYEITGFIGFNLYFNYLSPLAIPSVWGVQSSVDGVTWDLPPRMVSNDFPEQAVSYSVSDNLELSSLMLLDYNEGGNYFRFVDIDAVALSNVYYREPS